MLCVDLDRKNTCILQKNMTRADTVCGKNPAFRKNILWVMWPVRNLFICRKIHSRLINFFLNFIPQLLSRFGEVS